MRSAGATYLGTLIYAVFPQIMPRQIGLSIYQLDSNLRASAVVGIVGAGGIGATLANAFKRYDYDFALAIIMVIVGAILHQRGGQRPGQEAAYGEPSMRRPTSGSASRPRQRLTRVRRLCRHCAPPSPGR